MLKVKRRVPGGRVVIRRIERKPSSSKCASCGKSLHGVPRLRVIKLKKLSKTERRPSRPYGGYFCSGCTRELFRERVRSI